MNNNDDAQEKANASLAAAMKVVLDGLYTPIEIERRAFRARFRKAEFDAQLKAGFTEMQALVIVSKLI